ncbi:CPBP family intramembrane metalloprotease [Temperatibacter marinus]|uniref:CPBP family intramembrane metalloprotease n=1 Tax=Temperatibacter marinus TaxID=1456591 RepID=A0AA52EK67_9PROT|nr:CPBP family intramembrane glutamic endopeptidase [Temperatibacter marinus]WND04032.1 CPBP family intramembrane metalloprotease [Temperatibacter marinus]
MTAPFITVTTSKDFISASSEGDFALIFGGLLIVIILGYFVCQNISYRRQGKDSLTEKEKIKELRQTIILLWSLCAIALIAWFQSDRGLQQLGFTLNGTTESMMAFAIVTIFCGYMIWQIFQVDKSQENKRDLLKQFETSGDFQSLRFVSKTGYWHFQAVAVTAGITEEIIFRAFAITALSLYMPIWAATIIAGSIFVISHSYQGLKGMMRTIPITIVFTILFLVTNSLIPVIILHIVVDIVAGILLWKAAQFENGLRDKQKLATTARE